MVWYYEPGFEHSGHFRSKFYKIISFCEKIGEEYILFMFSVPFQVSQFLPATSESGSTFLRLLKGKIVDNRYIQK